ncbi:MAG: hypothetical protein GX996_04365 [Firmicutes bacterium]|nr:hypothetical protein [Bacillota bacterium]
MISKLFFDTDCLSAFLWVSREDILFDLFPGKIVLPKQVYDEFCHPSIPHFKRKIDQFTQGDKLSIKEILLDTEEYHLYYELSFSPPKGETVIGKGEAAVIVLARAYNGIIASSNFRDVAKYARKYNLKHLGTGDILIAAFKAEHIDEVEGNNIWQNMLAKRRALPKPTFSEYLRTGR